MYKMNIQVDKSVSSSPDISKVRLLCGDKLLNMQLVNYEGRIIYYQVGVEGGRSQVHFF